MEMVKKRLVISRSQVGGREDFQGSETPLCDTIVVHIVQIHRTYNTKSEPKCELCTLDDNNVSVQVHRLQQMYHSGGDVDDGKEAVCEGAQEYVRTLCNFAVAFKMLFLKVY